MLLHAHLMLSDAAARQRLAAAFEAAGAAYSESAEPEDLPEVLDRQALDLLVFAAEELSGQAGTLITELQAHPDRPAALALVDEEDALRRAELLGAGCVAVLNLALPPALLGTAVRALVVRLQRERQGREGLLGGPSADRGAVPRPPMVPELPSPPMAELLALADRVAAADSTLLLLGETGVGKEWLARRVHAASRRGDQPFVAINCAAVPDHLLESELFGHVQGAFTGATRTRRGHFEMAHGGTLFLDEVAEMPPHLQGKLLRAVQELVIQRVGSEETMRVDVRLMAATSRGMEAALAEGTLRPDLYYRLAVVTLTIPPLRDRPEDVEPLVRHYLDHFGRRSGRPRIDVSEPVLAALRAYFWPGNVRELVNVVERAVVLGDGDALRLADLPAEMRTSASVPGPPPPDGNHGEDGLGDAAFRRWLDLPLSDARRAAVDWFERCYLERALRTERGRIGSTARRIGLDPRSLHGKMKHHELRKEDFR